MSIFAPCSLAWVCFWRFWRGRWLSPALADALAGDPNWQVFARRGGGDTFYCHLVDFDNREARSVLSPRQSLIMVTASWLAIALFGALPFLFSDAALSFSDAFFESASGITTTGATVLTGLETLSPGLLLWRGMLQWLGGGRLGGGRDFRLARTAGRRHAVGAPQRKPGRKRGARGTLTLGGADCRGLCRDYHFRWSGAGGTRLAPARRDCPCHDLRWRRAGFLTMTARSRILSRARLSWC